MTNDQEFTSVNTNAFLLVAVGLLVGFIGGYIARPHFQPRTPPPNVLESMTFTDEYTEKFPYTFANRSEAVTWLDRHVSFLDRHLPAADPARSDVEQMKFQLREIHAKPTADLPIVLFKKVNANVEQLQSSLGQSVAANMSPAPPDTQGPPPSRVPKSFSMPRHDN